MAVIAQGHNPYEEGDLAVYRARFGIPPCTTASGCLRIVDPTSGYLQTDEYSQAGAVAALELVSAVCPRCHLLLVHLDYSDSNGTVDAVDRAVRLGATQVVLYPRYVLDSVGPLDHPGVLVTVPAFDDKPYWPLKLASVVAVGATALSRAPNTRGWTELNSHSFSYGTSGSCATDVPKPAWQPDTGCTGRAMNDVSAVGDEQTPVAVYSSYAQGWVRDYGSGVSAAIVGGISALAGSAVAGTQAPSYAYGHPGALNDVTSGSVPPDCHTRICGPGPGWDGPTGLGTPNGASAFEPTMAFGTLSGTVTSPSGSPVPDATVSASSASSGGDSGTAVTQADGTYLLRVRPGRYTVRARTFGYASATQTVTVADSATTMTSSRLRAVAMRTV
ncbi:MAG: carboxypeptidase regulatory-like domain-containing protein, partial [Lapillicoccus sp.]